tara:strand:- start:4588 stop:4923 length:336 start_codon:yes stop_codon:yes gene_type:complete
MDFTILFQRFAEQSPLIILCGLIIWQLLKMYKEEKALLRVERQERQTEVRELISSYTNEIRQINDKHTAELKELNAYTRERDLETQESLQSSVTAIEAVYKLINQKFRLLD